MHEYIKKRFDGQSPIGLGQLVSFTPTLYKAFYVTVICHRLDIFNFYKKNYMCRFF